MNMMPAMGKALIRVAEEGRMDRIKLLLASGVIFNITFKSCLEKAISAAQLSGHTEIMDLLIQLQNDIMVDCALS